MSAGYSVRPKADRDLDEQAVYFAEKAGPEVGHRFLLAAHQAFTLLATQPEMGWHPRIKHLDLASMRMFRISGFKRILILYRPKSDGVEILRVIHASRDLARFLSREGIE